MLDIITNINNTINYFVWGWPALILLTFVGILMTCLTRFFQITHITHWFKQTLAASFTDRKVTKHTHDKSISQFQSLCIALAATVGTGNIVGVAGAIMIGGPGAVFWMWSIAFFGMMIKYAENVLGIYYRHRKESGEWAGGTMYYLRDGLGAKKGFKTIGMILAGLFALFCLLASFGLGNMTQINSISDNMESVFGIPKYITGILMLILVGVVMMGGLQRIANVAEKLIPFMIILYIVGSLVVLIANFSQIGPVFTAIFKGAFSMNAAGGGIVGYGSKLAIEQGMKRGVFSNESGLGSSVLIHSCSNAKEPVCQGMWGILEVFIDTFVVCTLTAFSILSSNLMDLETGVVSETYKRTVITGNNLVSTVFSIHFGFIGAAFVAIAVMLFAFSTVLSWSQYGSVACSYLFGEKSVIVYRFLFILSIFGGAVMKENLAWNVADTLNGMMMLPDLVGLFFLSPIVYRCTKNYVVRRIKGQDAEPMLSHFEDIQKEYAESESL